MKQQSTDAITWIQFNNVVPVIVTFVGLAVTYGALLTRLSVLENKMDNLTSLLQKHEISQEKWQTATNDLEHRMAVVETKTR
jgi:hypothetical protein